MKVSVAVRQDYLTSFLRMQVRALQSIIFTIEKNDKLDDEFFQQALKNVEVNLRQVRKQKVSI